MIFCRFLSDTFAIYAQDSAGSGGNIKNQGGKLIITDLAFMVGVTAPTSSYYTFNGAASAALGKDYSFSLTPTIEGLDDFVVFVDGEEIACVDGVYTVENVTKALTIEVLHGYIEKGNKVTASYEDNTITLTHAALANTSNAGYYAYISKDYIEYMYSQGYKILSFTYACDGEIAVKACYKYNGVQKDEVIKEGATPYDVSLDLSLVTQDVFFWGMNAGNSGNAIKDADFWLKITNLAFLKESITVEEELYAETATNTGLVEHEYFVVGDSYVVSVNGETTTATVTTAGQLEFSFTTLEASTGAALKRYSVVCKGNDHRITFSNVLCVNDAIRTCDELTAISRLKNGETSTKITGYYVLANDLDFASYGIVTPGGNYNYCHQFGGVFHGKDHTIRNISVGTCGIFGVLANAYIQNLNFENVKLVSNDNYVALLAGKAWGTKIWHVNVQYSEITVRSPENSSYAAYDQGLLFSRLATGTGMELKYVNLDATDLRVPSIFGSEATFLKESVDAGKTNFVSTVITVGSYFTYGYTGSGNGKLGTEITEIPEGIEIKTTLCSHEYDNDCDELCNNCGEERVATHPASWSVQEGKDVYACECGKVSKELITVLPTRQKLDLNWTGIEGTAGSGVYNSLTGQKCNKLSMDLSEIGDWEITSATFDSTKTTGINALSFNGNQISQSEYGNLNYTVTVTIADGTTHSVVVPVLVVTNVITTPEELNGMYITTTTIPGKGGYFELGNDIEYNGAWLSWATWSNSHSNGLTSFKLGWANPETAGFQGTFDGCGYTISGLEMNITWGGFITLLGANGTIKNVSFADAKLTALGGYVCAWGCGTIENVHVQYAAGAYGTSAYAGTFFCADNARNMTGEMTIQDCYIDASAITSKGASMARWIGLASISGATQSYVNLQNVYVKVPANLSAVTLVTDVENGNEVYTSFSNGYIGLGTVIYEPATSSYYTFAETTVDGAVYAFTITPTVVGLDDFIVLLDGEELTATNGVYKLVEMPKGAMSIQVLHGYIEYGGVSRVVYDGDTITVTNSTSTSNMNFMAYISADYVNYMMKQGYTKVCVYMTPDFTVANQAIGACGDTIVRTESNYTTVAEITLKADTAIKFWCQKNGSGSAIQSQGGFMTITGLTYIK